MQQPTNQRPKTAAWVALCVALCSGAEGLRQTAYQDVTGTWTDCYGETRGVKQGDHSTVEQCKAKLGTRLYEFAGEVDRCTKVELPPERKAAMVDFAYNVGSTRYCSRVAPLLNTGKTVEACNKLLEYTKAGGIEFPGLVKRRRAEQTLCLKGLT